MHSRSRVVRRFLHVSAWLLAGALLPRPASPCTIFTLSQGGAVFFGGNEDQAPNASYLVVDRKGAYGVVYLATPWDRWPLVMATGVNEKGLCFDSNWIPEERLARRAGLKAPKEWAVTLLMKECSTVEELLPRIATFDWGDSVDYQVHFADSTGDAAVIHPGADGRMTYTRKPKGDSRLVSTNFNLRRLEDGSWSCKRYETANALLGRALSARSATLDSARGALEATRQSGAVSTIYSELYDLRAMRMYIFYAGDFSRPVELDVARLLAENKRGLKRPLAELFREGGGR
jgi:hypothetical protein